MKKIAITGELRRLVRIGAIPGAQFAVHREGVTWAFELGVEDWDGGQPMTGESKVPLGSVSKTFTAALVMVLVSDGDLDLDGPIAEHLPEAGGLAARITPRHLLSHTAGLPSDREPAGAATIRRHVLDFLRHAEPLAEPGSTFSYSNIGYVIAGHLIEAVTGMTWWEAMEVVLLKPLGLDTRFVVGPTGRRPVVTGHSVNPGSGRVRPVRQSLTEVDAPAGAVAASASDLVALGRLLAGLERTDLISPAVLAEMRAPVPGAEPFGVAGGWGLGLASYGGGWVGHDGTADGTSAHLRIEPATGTVVALTTNGSTGFAMWHELVGALREQNFWIGDTVAGGLDGQPALLSQYAECVGNYRNGDLEYSIAQDAETLLLVVDGELLGELTMYQNLVFSVRDPETGQADLTGRFLRESQRGPVDCVQVGGRLARRHRRAGVKIR